MSCASTLITADLPPPSARSVPRSCRGDGWDALADSEVFVFAVEAELRGGTGSDGSGAGRRAPPWPQAGSRPAPAPQRADLDADLWRPAVAHCRLAFGCALHDPAQRLRSLDPARAVAPPGPAARPPLGPGPRGRGPRPGR